MARAKKVVTDKQKSDKPKSKGKKVRFTKSPTANYRLAYGIGDIAYFPEELARKMIDDGCAESI